MLQAHLRYPIVIEIGSNETTFGVVVPDLPGCFSAGDTLDEAIRNAEEAVYTWIEATLDAGAEIPAPSSLESISANPEYAGWAVGIVEIDPAT